MSLPPKIPTATSRNTPLDRVPSVNLSNFPTSCRKMPFLSKHLKGPELYIKRDDVMDLAHGGNKTRKLEYVLAQAINLGSKAIITQGGLQSNHVRQTIAGATMMGLESHVILDNPVPEMKKALMRSGNYLLDIIMGAHVYFTEDDPESLLQEVEQNLTALNKKPYIIPVGASNGIGSMGYVNAARELILQWKKMCINPSHIFVATGSCGTQAGLLMGLRYFGNTSTKVIGISVSAPAAEKIITVRNILKEIAELIEVDPSSIEDNDIIVNDKYYGKAYGYPTDSTIDAVKLVAEKEGILLDPVYTGKAMSGLIDMIEKDTLENPRDIVFLHTGGATALHAYADYFLP